MHIIEFDLHINAYVALREFTQHNFEANIVLCKLLSDFIVSRVRM